MSSQYDTPTCVELSTVCRMCRSSPFAECDDLGISSIHCPGFPGENVMTDLKPDVLKVD